MNSAAWQRAGAWAAHLAHHLAWRLGWPGLAAAGMALATLLLAATTALHWQPEAEQVQQALARQQLANTQPTTAAASRATDGDWVARLPLQSQAPVVLATLHEHAVRASVRIERADYRNPSSEGALRRMQVVLPLQGSYGGIKRWLGRVLKEHPYCAVDELSFVRPASADAGAAQATVQARVVLSFYLRASR
jgi:hypothetical protein